MNLAHSHSGSCFSAGVEQYLGLIPQTCRQKVSELVEKIINGGSPVDHSDWQELAAFLGTGMLSNLTVDDSRLAHLVRKKIISPANIDMALSTYEWMIGHSVLTKQNLKKGMRKAGLSDQGLKQLAEFLLQAYIVDLNIGLQLLYQTYLQTFPPSSDATHLERLAALKSLEPVCYCLLDHAKPGKTAEWLGFKNRNETVERILQGLSRFFFSQYRVNFRFTYHCNISCQHCYNFSGPEHKKSRLGIENILAIIDAMPEVGIKKINITGGEPFLYQNELMEMIRAARANDVDTISIYTNGFWGKDPEKCKIILNRLMDAGFMCGTGRNGDHIKVSTGIYHQEFLKFETCIHLIREYHALFKKPIIVDYEVLGDASKAETEIRKMLGQHQIDQKVVLVTRSIAPIGRAVEISDQIESSTTANQYGACDEIFEIAVEPDGSVRPCCGLNNDNEGVIIGSVIDSDLRTCAMAMQNDPVLQFIASNPIQNIFDYLDAKPKQNLHTHICNACTDAIGTHRNDEDLKRKLSAQQQFFPIWFTREAMESSLLKTR